MTSSVEELKQFLSINVRDEHDLTLQHIEGLLKTKREQQDLLDTKLHSLKNETKDILSKELVQVNTQQQELDSLSNALNDAGHKLNTFIKDTTTTNEPKTTLIQELNTLEEKLKTIETAKGYIKALLVASELSSQAIELVKTEPEKAIVPYTQLVQFEKHISKQVVDEQYAELSAHLKKSQKRLWEELNQVLTANFKKILESLSWPTPIKPPYGPQLKSKLEDFEKAFKNLLMLESNDDILSPISIMLEGLSIRFRYHFETAKPTNRIDKPEWFLTHVKNSIAVHIPFLMTTVQPLMTEKIFVKDQFIRGLLQDVTRKLRKIMPELLSQPNYLSHTIEETLKFDKALEEEFAYVGYTDLSNVVMGNPIWFNTWFQAEKSFAQTRYDEIMLDRQAFDTEDDVENKSIKRTKSSIRLINLLENITNVYTLVPNLTQKIKFFSDIQLDLLDQYQERLSSAIDSFEALSLIRSVPVPGALPEAVTGVMTATETGGTVSVLHRLYRWWASAKYIVDTLQFWSEEEFFLDMQHELSQDSNQKLFNSATMDSLFSNTLNSYQQLFDRIEKIIVKVTMKEWTTETRKYAKKDTWWQTSTENISNEISDELYRPLQDLRVTFNYLHGILPPSEFSSVYKKTMKEIEEWYWKNIITQSQFSSLGASQLECDLKQGIWKIGQRWVTKPENFMKQLKEVILLLNLTLEGNEIVSCNELMKALSDNSQLEFVQKTLEKLGIEVLSNGQIRDVLRRRNDILYSWK